MERRGRQLPIFAPHVSYPKPACAANTRIPVKQDRDLFCCKHCLTCIIIQFIYTDIESNDILRITEPCYQLKNT